MSAVQRGAANQSQKLMVFVLTMALYGLATLFTELIPSFQVGIVEFSVEYFLFIPLTLAMLFDPLSAALGAATGELVFSEIMLGQFGGLGELEKFITVTIGVYVAGRLVRDPKNRKMVGIAAISGAGLQLFLGMIVDILKVQLAVADFGILFCLLPTLYLVPKLYGKIEPLLGMQPRTKETCPDRIGWKLPAGCALAFAAAAGAELLAESGMSLIDWEAGWAESSTALAVGMVVAAAVAVAVVMIMRMRTVKTPAEKSV